MEKFYVYAEDLASALIGPFDDRAAAEAHVVFLAERGDAAEGRVVTEAEAAAMEEPGMRLTPDEDRDWRTPERYAITITLAIDGPDYTLTDVEALAGALVVELRKMQGRAYSGHARGQIINYSVPMFASIETVVL